MRVPYIAGNWKMHKTIGESTAIAAELVHVLKNSKPKIMIAPAFTSLSAVSDIVTDTNILLGAQNISFEEEGAHTGETSIIMLKDIGVSVVILGHSERRIIYGENDEIINKKVHLSLKYDMDIILCVGETLEEREGGKVKSIVRGQLQNCLRDCNINDLNKITIAYEPVWAIGTGKTSTPEDADEVHKFIRITLTELYSEETADKMIIQYGGSVKPENIKSLMAKNNIDGALVGGASLKAETFAPIVEYNK